MSYLGNRSKDPCNTCTPLEDISKDIYILRGNSQNGGMHFGHVQVSFTDFFACDRDSAFKWGGHNKQTFYAIKIVN